MSGEGRRSREISNLLEALRWKKCLFLDIEAIFIAKRKIDPTRDIKLVW